MPTYLVFQRIDTTSGERRDERKDVKCVLSRRKRKEKKEGRGGDGKDGKESANKEGKDRRSGNRDLAWERGVETLYEKAVFLDVSLGQIGGSEGV